MDKAKSDMYVYRLRRVSKDQELGHLEADEILCDLLRGLGYDAVVDEWKKIKKWYA